MKTCSVCGVEKRDGDFYRRRSGRDAGKLYERCKACFRKRGVEYYHKNRARQLPLANARNRARVLELQAILFILKSKPCADCGRKHSAWVMEFDHLDGKEKSRSIARLVSNKTTLAKVVSEMKKCELVCANCHRDRTVKTHWKESTERLVEYVKTHKVRLLKLIAEL